MRFVNFVVNANIEEKVIWSLILNLRFEYLKKNVKPKCSNSVISDDNILNDFEKRILKARNNTSAEKTLYETTNISNEELDKAARMFISLFSCPSFYEKVYWNAIFGQKSKMIMLASNILKRAKGGFRIKALKMFSKITSVLKFKHISYHHEEIENAERKIDLKKVMDVKGDKS